MYLSQEVTSKDQQLNTQMAVSLHNDKTKNSEKVWQGCGFFGDHRSDLTIQKANFPENTLCYVNQGSVFIDKGGSQAIYLQLMPLANPDLSINLETNVFQEHEALLYVSVYNKVTGLYGGLTKKLAHIMLQGDDSERFYSYGFSKEKSALLYCTHKDPLPNIFHCTAFKKHYEFLLDENQKKAKFSKMFLYLPSTFDRKEDFLEWKDHFHLHPIDVSYDGLKAINDGEVNPALLDNKELRNEVVGGYYKSQIKIWFEILMLTFRMEKKLIKITNFLGLMILISNEKTNFN